jgi:FdhD protein
LTRFDGGAARVDQDLIANEAPLRIDIATAAGGAASLGTFMRTPGDDRAFALGLLYAEGVIASRESVTGVEVTTRERDVTVSLTVTLAPHVTADLSALARSTVATSACGLCGRLAIRRLDALQRVAASGSAPVAATLLVDLPNRLRARQAVFAETGGLHAAGLFTFAGDCVASAEDVGRHNAVDKLVGLTLEADALPASDRILVVTGRVAFEIVEKAAVAGIPMLVAVGAPSSLAVEAARATGLTLVGFARDGRGNVYAGLERVDFTTRR